MKGASFLRPGTRAAIVAEALFETRTKIARSADIPPERLLSSKTIMSLAPQRFRQPSVISPRSLIASSVLGADRVNPHRHNITLLSLLDALSRAHNEPTTAITTQKAKSTNGKDGELFGSILPMPRRGRRLSPGMGCAGDFAGIEPRAQRKPWD